jgi:CRP/FNR family cyclic AMP-dependent transcriptional regulator
MNLLEIFKESEDVVDIPAGSVVIDAGETPDRLFVVLDGEVEIDVRGVRIATARRGDTVGEMALISPELRSTRAAALTDARVAFIDQTSFESMLRHVPEFSIHLMHVLADRLRCANACARPTTEPAHEVGARTTPHPDGRVNLLDVFRESEDTIDVPAGGVIIREGEQGDLMYIVIDGEVDITVAGKHIATATPGEIIGEMALINPGRRAATVTALVETRLAVIDQASFESLVHYVPDFTFYVMDVLTGRLESALATVGD